MNLIDFLEFPATFFNLPPPSEVRNLFDFLNSIVGIEKTLSQLSCTDFNGRG